MMDIKDLMQIHITKDTKTTRRITKKKILCGPLCLLCALCVAGFFFSCQDNSSEHDAESKVYYLSVSGDDAGEGTQGHPWKSISKLNTVDLQPGDTVLLEGEQLFHGTLKLDSNDSGAPERPVVITSSGEGKATIDAGNFSAFEISYANHIVVKNLHLRGTGRKEGNTQNGMIVQNRSRHVTIDSLDTEGFQKSGLLIYSSSDIQVDRVHAFNNGAAGISVGGYDKKTDCRNIAIRNSLAENNPGDPTELDNHSGNGIIVGLCTNVLIEYCAATNNGWDMPRTGNGPVGIWAYEADSVVIQHCLSYRNKTSKGGEDGGGFDLDGGVTNSVIQYCLTYENHGSGFGLFQYDGASEWKNNVIRYNISENDGLVSTAHAGIYIWNGPNDEKQFHDCFIYNNVLYNDAGAAIHFATESKRDKFYYYNNIFVAKDELLKGTSYHDTFLANNWWSLNGGFVIGGIKELAAWATQTGQEKKDGVLKGFNVDPGFDHATVTDIKSPLGLLSFDKYKIPQDSPLRTGGLPLKSTLGIGTGEIDFNQKPALPNGIGASF